VYHLNKLRLKLSKIQCPTKYIKSHIGDGFSWSNDPTNSVKALKEDRVLRIRLQSHQVHPLCYNNTTHMQYEKKTQNTQTLI